MIRFAIVPGLGGPHPTDWRDKHDKQWLECLPSDIAHGLGVYVFEHGLLNADSFSWNCVDDGGNDLLACLSKLIADENVRPMCNIFRSLALTAF